MLGEFVEFLRKTNALALAVAVIIGAAIGKVVSGIVDDLIMPIIGVILPGGDWRSAELQLGGGNAIKYGDLLGRFVDFVIVAFVVFLITKAVIKPSAAPAKTKTCSECLETVPLEARRCRACTSVLSP